MKTVTKKSHLIEIDFNKELQARAISLNDEKIALMPTKNRKKNQYGYMGDAEAPFRYLTGCVGEVLFEDRYDLVGSNCYAGMDEGEFDFMVGGKKFEIKTSSCYTLPNEHWHFAINSPRKDEAHKQECDFYVAFSYLMTERCGDILPRAWLKGWIGRDEFWDNCGFYRIGEVAPGLGKLRKSDAYVIPLSKMWRPAALDKTMMLLLGQHKQVA